MLVNALVRLSTPLRSSCDPRPFHVSSTRESAIMVNDHYPNAVGMFITSRDQISPFCSTWRTEVEQKPNDDYNCVQRMFATTIISSYLPRYGYWFRLGRSCGPYSSASLDAMLQE